MPVKREAEETEPFVSVSATEQIRDDVLRSTVDMLRGEAEYVDTVKQREDVRGEDFPTEHPCE